jgi:hypothetical protein
MSDGKCPSVLKRSEIRVFPTAAVGHKLCMTASWGRRHLNPVMFVTSSSGPHKVVWQFAWWPSDITILSPMDACGPLDIIWWYVHGPGQPLVFTLMTDGLEKICRTQVIPGRPKFSLFFCQSPQFTKYQISYTRFIHIHFHTSTYILSCNAHFHSQKRDSQCQTTFTCKPSHIVQH